jgi:hypothetical protein
MVALREICKFQKTTNLLTRKAPFQHLVHKLALKFGKSDLKMKEHSCSGSPGGFGILHD